MALPLETLPATARGPEATARWCAERLLAALAPHTIAMSLVDPVSLQATSTFLSPNTGLLSRLQTVVATRAYHARDRDHDDPLSLHALLRSGAPHLAIHSRLEGPQPSPFPLPVRALGYCDEIRILLIDARSVWGAVAVASREPFTDEEIGTLLALAPELAGALRQSVGHAALLRPVEDTGGPGLVVLGPNGMPEEMDTRAAELLGPQRSDRIPTWAIDLSAEGSSGRTTLVGSSGILSAHLTVLGDKRVVIIDRARPHEHAQRMMLAAGLTPRQREVTECLCQGWDTRRIAFELDMADETVRAHVRGVFERLNVSSRAELLSTLLAS